MINISEDVEIKQIISIKVSNPQKSLLEYTDEEEEED